jgi:UDP-glucuronate 4-epimerase
MDKKKVIVTGSSGFIGMHFCKKLLDNGFDVMGIDNMNNYYSQELKKERLKILKSYENFRFEKVDISNFQDLNRLFLSFKPKKVINLAAQAGVRYSIENPHAYIDSNINGFMNILECCRHNNVSGLIYASSSSVYGGNKKFPFSVKDRVDNPISIYAASKKANELMANTYSHLYGLKTTGLRFFTVYGPWGRPDMAMYIFTKKIINGDLIPLFNQGEMKRDFTYIDDIIDGIFSAMEKNYQCEIFNLGNNKTEELMTLVKIIEKHLVKKAKINYCEMQAGDVTKTVADISYSKQKLGYKPNKTIEEGVPLFIDWYLKYKK